MRKSKKELGSGDTVVRTEVTKEAMTKFVAAKWKQVLPPTVSKKSGIFLLQSSSEDDMNSILELLLIFVFYKPLLLKKYEVGMKLGKNLFTEVPVWIRLPGLSLQFGHLPF